MKKGEMEEVGFFINANQAMLLPRAKIINIPQILCWHGFDFRRRYLLRHHPRRTRRLRPNVR